MNTCKHKRTVREEVPCERWNSYWEQYEDDTEIIEYEVSTEEDIDTHRYKCTLCGKIGYYSGSARDHYENGIPSFWVTNFNKKA